VFFRGQETIQEDANVEYRDPVILIVGTVTSNFLNLMYMFCTCNRMLYDDQNILV